MNFRILFPVFKTCNVILHNVTNYLFLLVCNSLTRTFAGSCIGFGLLTTNRETFSMTDSAIAANLLQSLDVHSDLSAKITLNSLSVSNNSCQLLHFVIGQILNTGVRINASLSKDTVCTCSTDSVDLSQTDFNTFFSW